MLIVYRGLVLGMQNIVPTFKEHTMNWGKMDTEVTIRQVSM